MTFTLWHSKMYKNYWYFIVGIKIIPRDCIGSEHKLWCYSIVHIIQSAQYKCTKIITSKKEKQTSAPKLYCLTLLHLSTIPIPLYYTVLSCHHYWHVKSHKWLISPILPCNTPSCPHLSSFRTFARFRLYSPLRSVLRLQFCTLLWVDLSY